MTVILNPSMAEQVVEAMNKPTTLVGLIEEMHRNSTKARLEADDYGQFEEDTFPSELAYLLTDSSALFSD